jgi:hypothetical protein
MGGLLGQDAVDKLKGRAATTGIANAVLGYLAAPKNQNLGLGRIIGQSLQAGMTGAQGVYDTALNDWKTKTSIEDYNRKKAEFDRAEKERTSYETARDKMIVPAQYGDIQVSGAGRTTLPSTGQAPNYGLGQNVSPATMERQIIAPEKIDTSAITKLAMQGNPQAIEYLKNWKELQKIDKSNYLTVGAGDIVYDTAGNIIATGGIKPNDVTSIQEYERAKTDPQFRKFLTDKWTAQAQAQAPFKSAAQQLQEEESAYKYGNPPPSPPKSVTLQDIADTAAASGKTTAQVTSDLKRRGITIKGAN